MEAVERARDIGREQGERAAREWLAANVHNNYDRHMVRLAFDGQPGVTAVLPTPDLIGLGGAFAAVCQADVDAYEAAFHAAVRETVEAACREVAS